MWMSRKAGEGRTKASGESAAPVAAKATLPKTGDSAPQALLLLALAGMALVSAGAYARRRE